MKKITLTILATTAVFGFASAQTITAPQLQTNATILQQGRQGRQGGMMMQYGPGSDYFLLRRADVKAELKITDDQQTKLDDAQKTMRSAMQSSSGTPGDASNADARKAADKAYADTVGSILTSDQKTRLHQIAIQLAKNSATMMPDVQKSLGLSDDQIAQIKKLVADEQKANRDLFAKVRSGDMQRSDAMTAMKSNTDVLNDSIGKILTSDQQTQLKTLGGDTFTPTDPQNGFGGSRRGGGGGAGGVGGG